MKKISFFIAALCATAALNAGVVSVQPGSGTLQTAYKSAKAGDELVLSDGDYIETNSWTWNKNITIKSKAGTHPQVQLTKGIVVTASLDWQGLNVSLADDDVLVKCLMSENKYNVSWTNCYVKALRGVFIKASDQRSAEKYISTITLKNTTLDRTYTSTTSDSWVEVELSVPTSNCSVIIDHCTVYGGRGSHGIYLPYVFGAKITNSIFDLPAYSSDYESLYLYGSPCKFNNCVVHNASYSLKGNAVSKDVAYTDPLFVDAKNGNYQLFKNSPAVGFADDGSNLGDPRWGVSEQEFDFSMIPDSLYVQKRPYSMAPTTSSVRVLWEVASKIEEGIVRYGTDPKHLDHEVRSTDGLAIVGEGQVHVVTLTGLQPFTRYYYQVGDSTKMIDDTCSTKTAPEEGTPFRIFTISDIHINACQNWSNMQDFICSLDADLAMCNGDFVNHGGEREWNEALFKPGRPFMARTPFMSAIGNHESAAPNVYRYSTFYDYFWQFSHGYIDEPELPYKDPRGEAYFSYEYGNALICAVNVNGDKTSPSHKAGSLQLQWMEQQLQSTTKDWVLIFGHVGLTSSAYHGSSPPSGRDAWRALFEKYVAQGKKIIYFCGDDHSLEHAYKDGVHYVRPGCGRNSNYVQIPSLKDANYTVRFQSISCYSTLDMAADASTLHLTTRDSVGTIIYEYTFHKDGGDTIAPTKKAIAPVLTGNIKDNKYFIAWHNPVASFNGTIIVRNEDHFPTNRLDGEKVYEGTDAETCFDTSADVTKLYYYGAFAYDNAGNISTPTDDSQWLSSDLNPYANLPYTSTPLLLYSQKHLRNGQILIERNNTYYTLLGTPL